MELNHWKIDANRIDVRDEDASHIAFVSFKNTGFAVRNVPTKHYFSDQAVKFLEILFALEGFETEPFIERIGVRLRVCKPFDGEFSDLVEKYSSNFITISKPAKDALQSKLLDIGSPLVLEDKIGKINLLGGPMGAKQTTQFFATADGVLPSAPSVGLVFDIDYWSAPKTIMAKSELTNLLRQYAAACWSMNDRLTKLVLG